MIVALIVSALAAGLAVWVVLATIADVVEANETRWLSLKAAAGNSALSATLPFVRFVFYRWASSFGMVQNLLRKSRRNLTRAGLSTDPEQYVGDILWQGLMTAVVMSVIIVFLGGDTAIFLAVLLGGLWSFMIQPSLLDSKAELRTRLIYRRIPYALDLSILVLETGGTLRQGLEEIAQKDDPLAEEFRIALAEIDSGATQRLAFRNLSRRVALEPLETVLMAITRGQEMGSPMVLTLTTQAESFREARLQQIEKLAVEAPTKMAFPNMMIMFSVLLLIVGPLLMQLMSSGVF
jgi:Flp pilus assembly protein TadB